MILFLILVALGGHDKLHVLPKVWLKVHWKYRTEDLHLARSLTIDPLQAFVTYLLLDQQKLLSYNHTNAQHKINYVCNSQNQMFSAVNLRVKVMSFLAPQLLFDLRDNGTTNHHHHHRQCHQLQTALARVLNEVGKNQKPEIIQLQFRRWWAH